jgi:hypothetical protein
LCCCFSLAGLGVLVGTDKKIHLQIREKNVGSATTATPLHPTRKPSSALRGLEGYPTCERHRDLRRARLFDAACRSLPPAVSVRADLQPARLSARPIFCRPSLSSFHGACGVWSKPSCDTFDTARDFAHVWTTSTVPGPWYIVLLKSTDPPTFLAQ